MKLKTCFSLGLFLLLILSAFSTKAQIRLYLQYETVPFYNGGSSDFNVLTGIKLDPNKELVFGVGVIGRLNAEDLDASLKFEKTSFSLGFNYYQTRRLYYNVNFNFNIVRDAIETSFVNPEALVNEFFLDYQINITYIVLRRLHFSLATGITHFTNLIVDASSELIEKGTIPTVGLSMKLYVFQIKL